MYQLTYGSICAGFVVEGGKVTACAPVLRKRIAYWRKVATWVGP